MKLWKGLSSYIITFLGYFLLRALLSSRFPFLYFLGILEKIQETQVHFAAVVTFINVLILTMLFTVGDVIRRKLTVDRPVKEIQEVLDRLTKGDYSAKSFRILYCRKIQQVW